MAMDGCDDVMTAKRHGGRWLCIRRMVVTG